MDRPVGLLADRADNGAVSGTDIRNLKFPRERRPVFELCMRVRSLSGWTHRVIIFCGLALLALLVLASLIPAKWQILRTGLGWQSDHFIGFFVATSVVCSAWPRPLLIGPILMAAAALLEGLQALTPDRVPNFEAALYGAGGTLVAALFAALFIRVRKRGAG
jgi:hypothetical protein